MVVLGITINPKNKLIHELTKDFNQKLKDNLTGITGKAYIKKDTLIIYNKNLLSMFDLPRTITYYTIKIKWKKKGYKDTFKLINDQKLLEKLIK